MDSSIYSVSSKCVLFSPPNLPKLERDGVKRPWSFYLLSLSFASLIFEIAARCDTERDRAYRNPIDSLRPILLECASGDLDKKNASAVINTGAIPVI